MNTDKYRLKNKAFGMIFCLIFPVSVGISFAQTINSPPRPPRPTFPKTSKESRNTSGASAEKSIAADAKVSIQLCVSEGRLKVNGWERGEIRAFIGGGSAVGFEVLQKNALNNAIWVKVLGFDPANAKEASREGCLSGEEIELDVPRGAALKIRSSQSDTTIDSIRKVTIEIDGGDIFVSGVAEGVEARTFEGDVTIENSSGAMTLGTTTGNIVALGVGPSEIGDVFKAKTNSGAIVLQRIGHRQAEVNSNSGSIKFTGEFQSGGQYSLGTQNGSISLSLPEKSSFKLDASFGFGAFNSEIPLENLVKNSASRAQSLSASAGKGEATLNLKTVSGAIRIKKQ